MCTPRNPKPLGPKPQKLMAFFLQVLPRSSERLLRSCEQREAFGTSVGACEATLWCFTNKKCYSKSTSIVSNHDILMEFQQEKNMMVLERSGIFRRFFFFKERNQELGSPKNLSRVEDHQRKSYPFLFSFKWIPLEIHLQIHPIFLFLFF